MYKIVAGIDVHECLMSTFRRGCACCSSTPSRRTCALAHFDHSAHHTVLNRAFRDKFQGQRIMLALYCSASPNICSPLLLLAEERRCLRQRETVTMTSQCNENGVADVASKSCKTQQRVFVAACCFADESDELVQADLVYLRELHTSPPCRRL